MILFRKFRFLLLMVFLLACTMHIMIDLLPKLERRAGGADASDASLAAAAAAACSCVHEPSEDPRSRIRPPQPVRSNKHTLRILQDFSNEPGSNLTGSREKLPAGEKTQILGGKTLEVGSEKRRGLVRVTGRDARMLGEASRLSALYQQPLYRIQLPDLTDEDALFNVNTDMRFYPKTPGNQEW